MWGEKSSSGPLLSDGGQNKLGSCAHLNGWTKQKRQLGRERGNRAVELLRAKKR